MVTRFLNRVNIACATTGTGASLALNGAAISTVFVSAAQAGVADGDVISYVLLDGADFELSYGTVSGGGTLISRTVRMSKISGSFSTSAAMNLSGNATLYTVEAAEDLPSGMMWVEDIITGDGTVGPYTLTNTPISAAGTILVPQSGTLQPTASFSVSGKTITLGSILPTNETAIVKYMPSLAGYITADIARGTFTASSGIGTIGSMSVTPPSNNSLFVWYGNSLQPNDASVYTWSGTTLTSVVDPEGDDVTYFIVQGLSIGVPGDGTVTFAKLSSEIASAVSAARYMSGSVLGAF